MFPAMNRKIQKEGKKSIVLIAASESDANLFYATKFLAPDPFIFIQIGKKKTLVASDLELDRAKKQASVDEVFSSSHLQATLRKKGVSPVNTIEITSYLLHENGVQTVTVPFNFPFAYADALLKKGFQVEWKGEPFFEERAIKTNDEIQTMTQALRSTERAIEAAVEVMRRSNIRGKYLIYKGKKLRSEDIKRIINVKLMEANCIAAHTIVSCYNDCVDPHNQGSGPLLANQSIIIDVFPHSSETMYFADITRTFVRGKASPMIKKIYAAVKEGQEIAFDQIKDGADGSKIHGDITHRFEKLGFKTGQMNGRMQGFFHGTGHGVGIEIHEPPRISIGKDILRTNHVVTVEPGLYYRNIGGVRLEDMVIVKRNGCANLTKFPKYLEI